MKIKNLPRADGRYTDKILYVKIAEARWIAGSHIHHNDSLDREKFTSNMPAIIMMEAIRFFGSQYTT